jgi:hypothetical protein
MACLSRRDVLLDKTVQLRDVAANQQLLRAELDRERVLRAEAEAAARAAGEREQRLGYAFEEARAQQADLEKVTVHEREARIAAEKQRQHAIGEVYFYDFYVVLNLHVVRAKMGGILNFTYVD